MASQWANLFQCPQNPANAWTCGGNGWASKWCNQTDQEVWQWQQGSVVAAQVVASPSPLIGTSSSRPTPTRSSTLDPQSSQATCTENTHSSNTMAVKVGLGVSLPLLAVVLIISTLYLVERGRRRRAEERMGADITHLYSMTTQQSTYSGNERQQATLYTTQELPSVTIPTELPDRR